MNFAVPESQFFCNDFRLLLGLLGFWDGMSARLTVQVDTSASCGNDDRKNAEVHFLVHFATHFLAPAKRTSGSSAIVGEGRPLIS